MDIHTARKIVTLHETIMQLNPVLQNKQLLAVTADAATLIIQMDRCTVIDVCDALTTVAVEGKRIDEYIAQSVRSNA